MDEIAAETMKWITSRYGPVSFETVITASVPTYGGGTAEGKGTTQSEAISALYADLTGSTYQRTELSVVQATGGAGALL